MGKMPISQLLLGVTVIHHKKKAQWDLIENICI